MDARVKWYVKFPYDMYAFDFYCSSRSEREARRTVRQIFGYDRLPVGTQVWR